MPEQYLATDSVTGLTVMVTGEFPEEPDDRVRIARTATLFTRLFATILATDNSTERRQRFRAVETQLEVADALIRQDLEEVQRLVRNTMSTMGLPDEQLQELEEELRRQLGMLGEEESTDDRES